MPPKEEAIEDTPSGEEEKLESEKLESEKAEKEAPPETEIEEIEEEDFDKDRALATIRKQRESEKALATQVKQLQTALKTYQEKEEAEKEKTLTETQKLEKKLATATERLEALEAENTRLLTYTEFTNQAKELGLEFVNIQAEKDAFAFISGIEVKDGKVKGMEEAVKNLLKARPYFFNGHGEGLPGTPPRGKRPKSETQGKPEPIKINF